MTVYQRLSPSLLKAKLSVADIYALQESGVIRDEDNFELIEGEIVPMAAAKFNHHEWMKSRLNEVLVQGKPHEAGLFVEPSISFSEDTLLEPDIALWPRDIGTQDVRGPDILLIVEVAASSIGFDLRVKAPLYASFGVRDYWVVDAVRKSVRIHRDPSAASYRDVNEWDTGDTVRPLMFPDIAIRLADLN